MENIRSYILNELGFNHPVRMGQPNSPFSANPAVSYNKGDNQNAGGYTPWREPTTKDKVIYSKKKKKKYTTKNIPGNQ